MEDYVLNYLNTHYKEDGALRCAVALGMSRRKINWLANKKLNLYVGQDFYDKNRKESTKFPLKIPLETILTYPEICYVLGYIYADGTVAKNSNLVTLDILTKDMVVIKPFLEILCDWTYYDYDNSSCQPHTKARMTNVEFRNFLVNCGFLEKSTTCPLDMFNRIPYPLQKYFVRGYLDGDGTIYMSKAKRVAVAFYATHDNDWRLLQQVFEQLNIVGYIYKECRTRGRSSNFRTSKKNDVIKFCEYVYENFMEDKIGLPRKYDKYLSIKHS